MFSIYTHIYIYTYIFVFVCQPQAWMLGVRPGWTVLSIEGQSVRTKAWGKGWGGGVAGEG